MFMNMHCTSDYSLGYFNIDTIHKEGHNMEYGFG